MPHGHIHVAGLCDLGSELRQQGSLRKSDEDTSLDGMEQTNEKKGRHTSTRNTDGRGLDSNMDDNVKGVHFPKLGTAVAILNLLRVFSSQCSTICESY